MGKLFGLVLVGLLLVSAQPVIASDSGLNARVWIYGSNGVPQRSTTAYPLCTEENVISEVQTLEDLFGAPFQEVEIAGCAGDYVLVNLTGYITLDPGTYTFNFTADDGLYLRIGEQVLTTDAVDWIIKPPGGSRGVQLVVTDFYSLPVDYWFFDNEFGSYANVEIRDSRGNEVSQVGLFSKSAKRIPITPPSYEGPLGLRLQENRQVCGVSSWTLTGQRLQTITSIKVAGSPVEIKSTSSERIDFELPKGLPAGSTRFEYAVPGSNLNLFEIASVSPIRPCASELLRISGLAIGSAILSGTDISSVKALALGRKPDQNLLTCVGTANATESANPRLLARSRALAACKIAQAADRSIKTRIFVSIGTGNKAEHRGVTLKLSSVG